MGEGLSPLSICMQLLIGVVEERKESLEGLGLSLAHIACFRGEGTLLGPYLQYRWHDCRVL